MQPAPRLSASKSIGSVGGNSAIGPLNGPSASCPISDDRCQLQLRATHASCPVYQFVDQRQNAYNYGLNSGGGWMQSIRLLELGIIDECFIERRIKQCPMLASKIGEHRCKAAPIYAPATWLGPYAAKKYRHPPRFKFVQN